MVVISYNICNSCLRIQSPTIKRKSNGKFIKLNNGILYTDDTFTCHKCIYIENVKKITLIKTSINTITLTFPNEIIDMILDHTK
jgi:hypothetical protein